jgi:hypothetical protein
LRHTSAIIDVRHVDETIKRLRNCHSPSGCLRASCVLRLASMVSVHDSV